MRVLQMVGSLDMGGSQAMIINLLKAIDRSKVQFDFIIDQPNAIELAPIVEDLGAKIYALPKFNGINIYKVKKAWDNFFSEHPEYKILHSHVRSYASIYIPIAKKHGLKTIIHSHSTSNGNGILSFAKALLQYPLRFQADYFFACSREAGEWLFGKKIVNSGKYHMLYNGIDIDLYSENSALRKEYRKELDMDNKKVFINVGRLHESKNHDFLLRVFAELTKAMSDSILLIVGDGGLKKEIEEKIDDLHLNDYVKMLGSRNDIPNLLNAADCFLFPSKWEGFPVTVVEAQAAGLPCLISANIPNDVVISSLVIKLPINQGISCWIKEMNQIEYVRKDVSKELKEGGFDVNFTSKWLTEFYMELIKE